jgi:two-component system, NarL family, nitrate/nitrite response regulator NarL
MHITPKSIRVLLVDDHKSLIWGLSKLIESERPRMELAGTAGNMTEALTLAVREQPDIILLDIDLHGTSSLDSLPLLLRESKAHVIILTGGSDANLHDRAVLCGARGVIHKEEPAEIILKAIEKVHQGEVWLDRAATGRVLSKLLNTNQAEQVSPEAEKVASLTPREREIIKVIINQGHSTNKSIAGQMKMSEFTLRNHLTSIYSKLGIGNRIELVMYSLKHGLN